MAILKDERNDGSLRITGFDKIAKNLDELEKAEFAERLLKVAEPLIINALDAEMVKHPGELQGSLKFTGVRKSPRGYYIAYRATGDSKNGKRSNPEKMIYLINREYIRQRNGKPLKNGYTIPAYDVITDAIKASQNAILDAMQAEFDNIINELWGDD